MTLSKTQYRNSSLKSAWIIHERDSLINFIVCTREAEIFRSFLQEQKCKQAPIFLTFLQPSWPDAGKSQFYCFPSTLLVMLMLFWYFFEGLPSRHSLQNWLLPHHTWQVVSFGTSIPSKSLVLHYTRSSPSSTGTTPKQIFSWERDEPASPTSILAIGMPVIAASHTRGQLCLPVFLQQKHWSLQPAIAGGQICPLVHLQ